MEVEKLEDGKGPPGPNQKPLEKWGECFLVFIFLFFNLENILPILI